MATPARETSSPAVRGLSHCYTVRYFSPGKCIRLAVDMTFYEPYPSRPEELFICIDGPG